MTDLSCPACGIPFSAPDHWVAARRRDHAAFYCPNGHQQSFRAESPEEALRRQLQIEKQQRARLEQETADAHAAARVAERQAAAARGQVTRLKNRAANGVCPCCNRTFANLQRHMATKHAGFRAEAAHGHRNIDARD